MACSDVRDANGDRIVDGAYVRLPDGKHAWVLNYVPPSAQSIGVKGVLRVELARGGTGYFDPAKLVTVKPSAKALSKRKLAAYAREAISAAAHRGSDRARRS